MTSVVTKPNELVYNFSCDETEAANEIVTLYRSIIYKHVKYPVEQPGCDIFKRAVFARFFHRVNNVISFQRFVDQRRDVCRIVLEIAIHDNNMSSFGNGES